MYDPAVKPHLLRDCPAVLQKAKRVRYALQRVSCVFVMPLLAAAVVGVPAWRYRTRPCAHFHACQTCARPVSVSRGA